MEHIPLNPVPLSLTHTPLCPASPTPLPHKTTTNSRNENVQQDSYCYEFFLHYVLLSQPLLCLSSLLFLVHVHYQDEGTSE